MFVVSELFNFLCCCLCCRCWPTPKKKITFWSHERLFPCSAAVMIRICTELGKKLAAFPCWKWKLSCQKFSPLNNDYVVQLPASLLNFHFFCCVYEWSGCRMMKKKRKKNENKIKVSNWTFLVQAIEMIINHQRAFSLARLPYM